MRKLLGKEVSNRFIATAIAVAVAVGTIAGTGIILARPGDGLGVEPVPSPSVSPLPTVSVAPAPEIRVLAEDELSRAQVKHFEGVVKAFRANIRRGSISDALEGLQAQNNSSKDDCTYGYVGGAYIVGDSYSAATVALDINTFQERLRNQDLVLTKFVKFQEYFPPLVSAEYRGRYPNGEAYLKVQERTALFVVGIQCTQEVLASPSASPTG